MALSRKLVLRKFSFHWYEIDLGYAMCHLLQALGMITIERHKLIPKPSELREPVPAE